MMGFGVILIQVIGVVCGLGTRIILLGLLSYLFIRIIWVG